MSRNLDEIVSDVVKQVLDKAEPKYSVKREDAESGKMTLSKAKKLIEEVEKKAKEMGVRAVVAVSDEGGNVKAVECMDDAFLASYDIATNKAYTSVALKMPTKQLASLASPGGSLYGIQFTNGGKIVIFGGGEPLTDKNGKILGGLGVSGGTAEEDTYLGEYGRAYFEKTIL